jgi:iron complex transport system substrate-binding protein
MVTNQRSLKEILDQILLLGRMIGEEAKTLELIQSFQTKLARFKEKNQNKKPLKVYFEEWDQPRLSCIQWVSELLEACGGQNIFSHKLGSLAADRKVTDEEIVALNPDVIIGCWCGKKVKLESFSERAHYAQVHAIQKNQVFEVNPAIFLQPGPALFIDGLDQLNTLLENLSSLP